MGLPSEPVETTRVRNMIETLATQTKNARTRLSNVGELTDSDVDAMRSALEAGRSEVMRGMMQLPDRSTLRSKATILGEEVNEVIARLDSVSRAHHARASTKNEQAHDERENIFAQAEKTKGFCDTAPQEVTPCELDHATRETYRGTVKEAVGELQASWSQAILDCRLAERFKAKPGDSWQQQLGGVLLGLLFGVLGSGAISLASKGIAKASRAFGTTDRIPGVGDVTTPRFTVGEETFANTAATKIVTGVQTSVQAEAKQSLTTMQLAENAKQAVTIPADRQSFLDSLGDLPLAWRRSVNGQVNQLFDADLAALQVSLPAKAAEMNSQVFAEKIKALLQRYEEQVLAVDTAQINECRPVQVMMPHGVRTALVVPEKSSKNSLAGEWKDAPVRTGKWTFLRWVDDDRKEMAMGRAIQQESGSAYEAIATAGMMRNYSDASFWTAASLVQLAAQTGLRPAQQPGIVI
jgi:hypothetical protein